MGYNREKLIMFKKELFISKSVTTANYGSVMETRNHSKNGANPKSQMSRGNVKLFMLLVIVMLFSFSVVAQDVIILKNGGEIKSLVQEIGTEYVKYKKFDNQTGPIYNIAKTEIFMIKYENGTKDVFNEVAKPPEPKPELPKQTYQETVVKKNDDPLAGKRMFANPDGSISFEDSDYRIFGKVEIQNFLMKNCRPAYDQYVTGRRLQQSGAVCLAIGLPLSIGSIGLWFLPYSIIYGPIITGAFTGMWLGGAINIGRGNKMVNGVFETYNRICAYSKKYSSRLELGLNGNGIGMLLAF